MKQKADFAGRPTFPSGNYRFLFLKKGGGDKRKKEERKNQKKKKECVTCYISHETVYSYHSLQVM